MMRALALPTSMSRPAPEERLRSVVDEHYDVVWRFVRRMGVPDAGAEDAVQEVLLVFVRRMARVEFGSERSFLLGTALRVAADARRHQGRLREVTDERVVELQAAAVPDAGAELDRRRARRVLDGILDRLSDDLRTVFVMCELEELTMGEVADALGVAPGTVASRLRRAREAFGKLAAEVKGTFEAEGCHE
jgi:RNA polymerase sigma-70 factor (ECF subfamily)